MKTYQVRFRIQAHRFEAVLSALASVGPVVIEEVEAEPNGVTPPKASVPQLTTVMRKTRTYTRRDAGTGIGPATILKALAEGEQPTSILRKGYIAAGLSVKGIGAALAKAKERGLIENPRKGIWKLKEKVVE